MWWLPPVMFLSACGPAGSEVRTVHVVMATRDLNVGVPIGAEDVYGLQMDVRYVPDDVFLYPTVVLGRVPSARILANEPVRGRRLADAKLQVMVESLVPRDKQVVTLPLDPAVAVEPVAGSRVEVWVLTGGSRAQVLDDVTFLRIDHRSVALTLTDPEAEALDHARGAGALVVVPSVAADIRFAPPPVP